MSGGSVVLRSVVRTAGGGVATPPLATEPTLWAETSVTVGSDDMTDLTVPLRQGLRVGGHIVFDGAATPPASDQWPGIAVNLEPADGRTSNLLSRGVRGRVEPTGQFSTMGVPAGKYVLRIEAPSAWSLRSAMVNGEDMSDTAVELRDADVTGVVLTFTDRTAALSGTVSGASGTPDGTAAVIMFPTDRREWTDTGASPRRLKNVRASSTGAYSIPGLPAGDYFVVAVSDAATGDWQNADFLDSLSRTATRVHLDEGDRRTQALTTARVR
jgi:hypothetical protein